MISAIRVYIPIASSSIPGFFPLLKISAGGRDYLGVDGALSGLSMNPWDLEGSDIVIIYNCHVGGEKKKEEEFNFLKVLTTSTELLLYLRVIEEAVGFINSHPECHVFYFEPGRSEMAGLFHMSYWDMHKAVKIGFESAKRRFVSEFEYFNLVFREKGARLNPDIEKVQLEEVLEAGPAYKEQLQRLHGVKTGEG